MSQSPHPIDELLRRRLYDAEVPPPAFVWTGVEQALRRRRRRRWLFAWLLLGTLGAGGAGWFVVHRDPDPAATGTAMQPVETHTTTAAPPGIRPDGHAAAAHRPASTGSADRGRLTAANSPGRPASPSARREALPAAGRGNAAATPSPAAAHSEIAATYPETATTGRETGARDSWGPVAQLARRRVTAVQSRRGAPAGPMMPARPAYRPAASADAPPAAAKTDKPAAARKRVGSRHCYDFSKNPSAWIAEAYAGPTFEHKTMTPRADSFTAYRDERLATERPDWAFNGGVRLTRIFSRNFVLRTGLHYEQVVERFKHIELNVKRTEEYTDPATGEVTTVVNRYDVYRNIYNRYAWLDIPLQVGMELRAGRAGLSLHTGATFNVLFWKRGRILGPAAGRPMSVASGDAAWPDVFRRNVGVSMMSNLQCFYHLSARDRVFLEPYYRQILRPVTADAFPVTQRYSFWGLQAGFSHILQ